VSLPEPRPGLVIRYSFLWSHEHDRGAIEGSKDRPCAIVLAARREENGNIQIVVAPITHSPPADIVSSLEIPVTVCRSLGFDSGRHWLRFDELNRFVWPGYDLRSRTDQPGRYDYGMLPRDVFEKLRAGIVETQRKRQGQIIPRSE